MKKPSAASMPAYRWSLRSLPVVGAILIVAASRAPLALAQSIDPAEAFEREVLRDILQHPAGMATVGDLALPAEYLRRVADRQIRDAFHQQVHLVRADAETAEALRGRPPIDPLADPAATPRFEVLAPADTTGPHAAAWRGFLTAHPQEHPTRRGLRVPSLQDTLATDIPALPPFDPSDPLAALVARHLAGDGLVRTMVRAAAHLHERSLLPAHGEDFRARLLRAAFPVDLGDLLTARTDADHPDHHTPHAQPNPPSGSAGPSAAAENIYACIIDALRRGADEAQVIEQVRDFAVGWNADPRFYAAPECGALPAERVRMQLTRGTDWSAPGDGGAIDMLRTLHMQLPGVPIDASIEERFIPSLVRTSESWPAAGQALRDIRVITEEVTLSQWIRDHAVSGHVMRADGGSERATLVPRYGSRGEPGSALIGGDTIAARGGLVPGERVLVAPLLFQGGNLLCVRDPARGEQVLFLGEAELHRNRTLGLSDEEVREGFRHLFGVDRVIVLTGPSFHIDFDVSFRSVGDRLVAFVHDVPAGAAIVLSCGVTALQRGGRLSAADAASAHRAIERGDSAAFGQAIGAAVYGQALPSGGFPWSLARLFSAGAGDSGIGNLQRFLLAIDRFHVLSGGEAILPDDPGVRAYYRAILRAYDDAESLRGQLHAAGCVVVAVPGFSEGARSISPINALHARELLLIPVVGGLYAPLDQAALHAFARVLGPEVRIAPVASAESLRRGGGLHCAAIIVPPADVPQWRFRAVAAQP